MANIIKKIKGTNIVSISECEFKGFLDTLNFQTNKGLHFKMASIVKDILQNVDFNKYDIVAISEKLNKEIEDKYFLSADAKKEEIDLKAKQIERYMNYENGLGRNVLDRGITRNIEWEGFEISVSADLIVDDGETIEVISFKTGAPTLSYRGQKEETKVDKSLALFLLYLLGKTLYPDREVIGSLYHLKSKKDKTGQLANFNDKKGENIVSSGFALSSQLETVSNKLTKTLTNPLSFNGCKTISTKCDLCSYKNVCQYEKPISQELEVVPIGQKASGNFTPTGVQLEAICFLKGTARLNAGAGAGKTTVIALRTVELIENGVKPEDILLITFTSKGAEEMREKIEFWLKENGREDIDVSKMHVMTFNSWGDMVLSENYKLLGFENKPRLVEKVEKYDIIFEVLSNFEKLEWGNYKNPIMNFPNAKGIVVELDEYFDFIKANYITDAEIFADRKKLELEKASDIYNMYVEFCSILKERGLVQYQDQINYIINLIEDHNAVLSNYNYRHIIVDEFQDTDQMQTDIISCLIENNGFQSLMVVGDDAQSIFGFKNCSPDIIINFDKYFSDVTDFYLTDNFRSTPEILNLANYINTLNKNRIDKNLVSHALSGNIPELSVFDSIDTEYSYIAQLVENEILSGTPLEEIAIITRTRSELFNIQSVLAERNIPTTVQVAEPIITNSNLHILVSFLDFIDNPDNTYGLFEYLFVMKGAELKELSEEELKEYLSKTKERFIYKFENCITEESKLAFFFPIAYGLANDDMTLKSFVEEVEKKNFPTLAQVFNYLRKIIIYEDDKAIETEERRFKAVTLITAHTSKGKEYTTVINTINKYHKSDMSESDIEETRRLLFVSFTRAKKRLFITCQHYMSKVTRERNRFVAEIENGPIRQISPIIKPSKTA